MTDTSRNARLVMPRRWLIAGSMVSIGVIAAGPGFAQSGEGGEGGEGAHSEAEGPAALLTALGLVEGHLRAGAALYAAGEAEMALTHKKHPGDEIYTTLAPMLDAVGAPGFADELHALAMAVETGVGVAEVEAAKAEVLAAIETARAASGATPYDQARAIEALVRTAADEYAIGIVDGAVDNLHEYQDAWGFVEVARDQATKLGEAHPEVSAAMLAALEPARAIFPELAPEGPVAGEASVLQGAAARIEIAGLELK